ncbi:gliding motility-associated peptidyl-prolyl isomerase GldI [Arenibacter latericius]|uniref:gliding motility-associated peptidyl-prolyl isomerase GldI n=1 Tax=Arenibacter latericius TaxID=86104 RepID=UPI000424E95F|nr:gliding motility-associated peptidyl-prolyl isomerase GldI [Arenibacter latericius]MDX1363073.1 gliding motility-associated peptidyl-prolyl isomerase GldI [Arenibacter latericius]
MRKLYYLLLLALITQCGVPEARKPIKVKTGSILKESVERNKTLLKQEEEQIRKIIAADSNNTYLASGGGTWYHYINKNNESNYYPQPDDLVTMQYNIISLDNDTIYSQQEIGTITYKVDKQQLFPGLRNSVKLLKEGERATFLIPSSLAYGYHGDKNKIGTNLPVKTTITIIKIDKSQN